MTARSSVFLPTGELSYARTGNTYAYQESMYYDRGTRRLEGVTTTQQTGREEDQLHELRHSEYAYDDAGNVLSVADAPDPALGGQPSDRQCFTYDWARRLTGAWTPASGDCAVSPSVAGLGGAEPYWKSYAYDSVGNRTSSTLHQSSADGGNVTSAYTRPEAGAAQPHAVSSVTATAGGATLGTSAYSYDQSGNMTGRDVAGEAVQELSWDLEGEVQSVAKDGNGDGAISAAEADQADGYVYSADGDRIVREQGGDTTVYLPGQELTLDGETGEVTANRYYSFAGRTVAVRDGSRASDVACVFSDHHNTGTIQVANTTNQVTRRYTDPFGAPRDSAAGMPDDAAGGSGWVGDHGFLDKPADASGLTAVGARMYDPVLGSFVSVDPVMDLSDPQQWNAYAYANSNPLTWTDPSGLLLGPLIDGAYTAPTRGQPGSGGWQVAPNNTGYTGSWNNGGAGKWSKPGTTYTPPVAIQRTSADIAAAADSVAAAKKRAEARRLQQRKAQEAAAAEAREAETQKREEKNNWLSNAASWASDAWTAWETTAGSDGWQTASAILGGVSAVAGVVAIVATATGVGAPVGAIAAGIAIATGVASTAIDCSAAQDVSCGVSIATTAVGLGGLGAAAKATKLGWKATTQFPSRTKIGDAGDNWQALGGTLDVASSGVGGANSAVSGVSIATGWDY